MIEWNTECPECAGPVRPDANFWWLKFNRVYCSQQCAEGKPRKVSALERHLR